MITCARCGSDRGVGGPCATCKRNDARARHADDVLQGFIGFIGSGYASRNAFPKTLTELSDDCREYVASLAAPSSGGTPT